ncbi:MAG: hypothetical protein JWN02_419 [Acidobacteria bacterium]|nr:hypothetical protein [Acidobacteriota bacterium]
MTVTAMILGGSRWQLDLIRAARRAGLRTLVTDIQAEPPGRAEGDHFVQIDTSDREGLLELARSRAVGLVLAEQTDRTVPVAAWLNEQLALPGIRPAVAQRFTDKYAMRNALRGSRVHMPEYAEVGMAEEALACAERWGYPLVLKPKSSQSSIGVFKVSGAEAIREHFPRTVSESKDGRILIEQFIEGTEITVEAFSLDGRCTVLAVSEKEHYPFNDCVARRLAYPPRFSPEVMAAIDATAREVVETLGLVDGISHAEYRLREGVPYLVEVAARGGGSRIASTIVTHVSGVDMYALLLDKLLHGSAVMPPLLHRAAVLEFLDFAPGMVKAIHGVDNAVEQNLVHEIHLAFAAGDTIRKPEDDKSRLGYFIALGEDRDEVDRQSAAVKALVQVEYE